MWSRLAKVATDLAQDLAQPEGGEEQQEEDEGYYEEGYDDGTGGWAEDGEEEDVDGLQQPPSQEEWQPPDQPHEYQEQQHYEEGGEGEHEQPQEEEYFEEGGVKGEYQQEGDAQPEYDEHAEGQVAEGDDNNGWGGEEEEFDFGVDDGEQQQEDPQGEYTNENAAETYEQQEQQPPDEEIYQQEEVVAAAGDDWDLEDEDLFEEGGENVEPQEETIATGNEVEEALDSNIIFDTVEDAAQNDWGDDSLDFNDSHIEEEEPTVPAAEEPVPEEPLATADPPSNQEQQDVVESADSGLLGEHLNQSGENEWGNDDSLNFDDSRIQEEEEKVPVETNEEAPQVNDVVQSYSAEGEAPGDAWGDDDLALDDSFGQANNINENEIADSTPNEPEQNVNLVAPPSHETFDTAASEDQNGGADGWNEDDDLAMVENEKEGQDNGVADDSELGVQESHDTFDTAELDPQSTPVLAEVETEDEGAGWKEDDIILEDPSENDHIGDIEEHRPEATESTGEQQEVGVIGEWGNDDLNLSDEPDVGADAGVEQTDDAGAWGDDEDFNLSHHVDEGEGTTQVADGSGLIADAWGDDNLNLSAHDKEEDTAELAVDTDDQDIIEENAWDNPEFISEEVIPEHSEVLPDAADNTLPGEVLRSASLDSVVLDTKPEDELQVFEDLPPENAWTDAEPRFDAAIDHDHELGAEVDDQIEVEQGDDDSTVEQSNIGFEQSVEELLHGERRRATIRASNTASAKLKGAKVGVDTFGATILGTSVTFTEHATTDNFPGQQQSSNLAKASGDAAAGDEDHSSRDGEDSADASVAQDAVSTVSDLTDIPKPRFETQISTLTLKSLADASYTSRRHDNVSDDEEDDDDNEDQYGPVVDKTPELSADQPSMPELSTMTITSTAVMAHSVVDDIQRDDDMSGGSAAGEAQSNENAWEEDDASSLGGLSEKIDSFETTPAISVLSTPLTGAIPEETTDVTPPLDSSMAIQYADDTSVPSRDKDDDNEEHYKPVVDQIPIPLKKLFAEKSGRTLNSMAVMGNPDGIARNQESTAHADNEDQIENDGWDDGASLGDLDSQEDPSEHKAKGAGADDKEASHIVVDKTPNDAGSTTGNVEGSVAAVESVENSCPSRVQEDDDGNYGPVVDQIPTSQPLPPLDQMSVAACSMAVVTNNVEQDFKQDEDLDASDRGDSVVGEPGVVSSEETDDIAPISGDLGDDDDRVVDLTPKMNTKKLSRLSSKGSLAVLAHSIDLDFEDENDDEENDANFGPIVDHTPPPIPLPTTAPSSTAVQSINDAEETKQDETTDGGIGDVDWDNDCPELEDMELGGGEDAVSDAPADGEMVASVPKGTNGQNQVALVDHTPGAVLPQQKPKGDASVAVLAPSEDGTCLSINDDDDDADTIDPHGERVSYGPMVDTLPNVSVRTPGTAPSVTFSLAVEARSVDEDFKMDDEMDETLCCDGTLEGSGENGWGDDQTLDEIESVQPDQMQGPPRTTISEEPEVIVDHTPQLNLPPARMGDASLVALAPSEAGTYRSADTSDNDDDTITHDEDLYGKVVDHTPKLPPLALVKSTSMAVGAASADYRSEIELGDEDLDDELDDNGWGRGDEALEDIDTTERPVVELPSVENLVDHTPEGEEQQTILNTDPSVAVLAPSEDGSHEEDDIDTNDGNHAYGPVVDNIPQLPESELPGDSTVVSIAATRDDGDPTLFGDSTVGGEPGWDDDDAILDDLVEAENNEEAIEAGSSRMDGSSVGKSSQDGVNLVDHTPSEISSSLQKNSVGWLANVESGISGDDTGGAGVSWEDNGGVGGDPPDAPADEDQLVDHIPHTESCYGDASTVVVADPSEVLSNVGDMLQEEGDYGPIVDVTPPTRPLAVLTATGSTAVVAPTVVQDDLDDADPDPDDTIDEENAWEEDQNDELELAPNPQSGNEEDEAARMREQVVDFLPPPQQNAAANLNPDGWSEASELATGGAPSVLQADPKEDEFGPVVDQLPLATSVSLAAMSTTSQVAASECAVMAEEDETEDDSKQGQNSLNGVVDPLLRPFEVAVQNLDSSASLPQSLASEDEDDDGRYGLVVDHLPSTRSSLPPSRGGSTVDALATVSEAVDVGDDDDDEEVDDSADGGGGDGWDDDDLGEIDLSEAHAPSSANPAPVLSEAREGFVDQHSNGGDRGMSVRFRSVVAAIFESDGPTDASQTNNNDQHDQQTTADDAVTGVPNAWDDDLDFDVSLNMDSSRATGGGDIERSVLSYAQFTEADTPPATPYSKTTISHLPSNGLPPDGVVLPDLALSLPSGSIACSTCENASNIDCPCVQRILKNKEDGDDTIKVDYNKLLQTEISKRRLIEEESNDLRTKLETLATTRTVGEVRLETVQALQEHVKVVKDRLRDAGIHSETYQVQNQELQQSVSVAHAALSEWEERQKDWVLQEETLRQEAATIKKDLEAALSETGSKHHAKEQDILEELEAKQEEIAGLSKRIEELRVECARLQDENASLVSEIQPLKQSLRERDESIQTLVAYEETSQLEIKLLSDAIQSLENASASTDIIQQECTAMETKLASKESECDCLQKEVAAVHQRVQAAEGERYTQMKEQARLAKQHEEIITLRQGDLDVTKAELQQLQQDTTDQASLESLRREELETEIARLDNEKSLVENNLLEIQTAGDRQLGDLHTGLEQKEMELQAVNLQLNSVRTQNASLGAELERLSSIAEQTQKLEEELRAAYGGRDTLLNSLRDANEKVERLQQQIEDQDMEEGAVEASKNREIEALLAERMNLQNVIIANNKQIEALSSSLERLEGEKQALQNESSHLRSAAKNSRLATARDAADRSELSMKFESIKQELATLSKEKEQVQQERDALLLNIQDLEVSLESAEEESKSVRTNLSDAQSKISLLHKGNIAIESEKDLYFDKCIQMEQMLATRSGTSQESSKLMQENLLLSEKVNTVQNEFNDQGILLQNFEVRMNALDNELAAERMSGNTTEATITGLRQELEATRANLGNSREGSNVLPGQITELEGVVFELEAERNELQHNLGLLASKEEEFQGVCNSLSNDRDAALNERDAIATENEEMLVQFGLLNEEIESHNEQIRKLHELVQQHEEASSSSEAQMLDLRQRLASAENGRLENREHHVAKSLERDAEVEDLHIEQSNFVRQIEQLTNENAEKQATVANITKELEKVQYQLQSLEEANVQSSSTMADDEALRSTIEDLEFQRSDLEAKLYDQSSELSQLQADFDKARNATSALENQVHVLEGACTDRDQALQQKEAETRRLVERIHESSGHSSETTQEILDLRDRLNSMEGSARKHYSETFELSGNFQISQAEVESTRASATKLKAAVAELEQQLIANEETARLLSVEQDHRIADLDNNLQWKSQELEDMTHQQSVLSAELITAASKLEAERSQAAGQANLATSGEIESLKAQLASSQEELKASRAQISEAETSNLQRSLASKDGEVVMLKHKIQSLSRSAKESQDEVSRMEKEMEDFQNEQRNVKKTGSSAAAHLLQHTKENADDVDNLRSTVITLANALETSENRRADAIDRLLRERETYADSLRRMSESVKRFYNTLSFSEA